MLIVSVPRAGAQTPQPIVPAVASNNHTGRVLRGRILYASPQKEMF